jgi:CRP-like cAMP-binding protein
MASNHLPQADDAVGFVRRSAWFCGLPPESRDLVVRTCSEKRLRAGDELVRMGDEATHWVGVMQGLLHMWVTDAQGQETTLAVIGEGEWCAEGSLIKRERYRYNAVAITSTSVALLPGHVFESLRANSLAFNRELQTLMNNRMSGFVDLLVADRMLGVEARVERCLRLLASKQPSRELIQITQQQFALLCGLSRQRVNLALRRLQLKEKVRRQPDGLRLL